MVGAAVHVEVVDVAGSEVGFDGRVHVLALDAQHLGPLPIEIDLDLGRIRRERRVDADEAGSGVGRGDEIVGRLGQSLRAETGAILQPHRETAGAAEAGDRRRLDDEDIRTVDVGHALRQFRLDRGGSLAVLHPLFERLEHDIGRRRTRRDRLRRSGKAGEGRQMRHARNFERDASDFLGDLRGALQRRAGGKLRYGDDVAAVLARDVALRAFDQQVGGRAEQQRVEGEHYLRVPYQAHDERTVHLRKLVEAGIKAVRGLPAKPLQYAFATIAVVASGMPLQHQRRQGRRQRERVEQRDHGCDGDGDAELAEELSRQAGHEGRRHEDRGQHQRDGDQRSADLAHRQQGRFLRAFCLPTDAVRRSRPRRWRRPTTTPTASTRPNRLRLLMENPKAAMTAMVPTSETGMARIGMIDGRHPCRKTTTTRTTSTIAS